MGEASTHEVRTPYIVVSGPEEGPTLCVLSGVHSIECASIEGVLRLAEEIQPSEIKEALIFMPVVNVEGFHARTPYHNAMDHLNQNRVFPGDPEGSMTRSVAHAVFSELVSKVDYLVDAHTADLGEDATHGMFIYKTGDTLLWLTQV